MRDKIDIDRIMDEPRLGGAILAGVILLIVLGLLMVWAFFFSANSPIPNGRSETLTALEPFKRTDDAVQILIAATQTAKSVTR